MLDNSLTSFLVSRQEVWLAKCLFLIFTLIFLKILLFLHLTFCTLKFYPRNNDYSIPINYTDLNIHTKTNSTTAHTQQVTPSIAQDFNMTLRRWSLLEAPQTTRRFSEDHIDFHSSSQWFPWAGNQASPSWSFQLLFFFNTAQVSSAFSLSSVKQQDPLIRNLMAKAPMEGSQEVQKDGTLIWQLLRTDLGAHKQLEDFLIENRVQFPAHLGSCQEKWK